MKLSEAILAGCKTTKQAFGFFYTEDFDGNLCTCALGCAVVGVTGIKTRFDYINEIASRETTVGFLGRHIKNFQDARDAYAKAYGQFIETDNDITNLSREEIAQRLSLIGY